MARTISTTITADGSEINNLKNLRTDKRNVYSVYVSGTFGGGTVTAFLQADGTNNIAILDAGGNAVSLTADGMFNFEAQSDENYPVKLVITLAGATSPSINLNVYNGA